MKIFDFKYNEKLKINPTGIDVFNDDKPKTFYKDSLNSYDIVYMFDNLYMVFKKDDVIQDLISFLGKEIIEKNDGMFFYCSFYPSGKINSHYMPWCEYNDSLMCITTTNFNGNRASDFDVKFVYKRMDNFPKPVKKEEITQEYLNHCISNYNFLKIELNHENI